MAGWRLAPAGGAAQVRGATVTEDKPSAAVTSFSGLRAQELVDESPEVAQAG